jgi:hypothetical protein
MIQALYEGTEERGRGSSMLSKKVTKYLDVEPPGADTGGHQDLNTARLEIRNGRVPAAHR